MRCEHCTVYYRPGRMKAHMKVCSNRPRAKQTQEQLDRQHQEQYGAP
jgi:hypothetical protein